MGAADAVIAAARARIGKPYATGNGSDRFGPNRYDCSGLVVTVFRETGHAAAIKGTVSYVMAANMDHTSSPAPADLVAFGNPGVKHVGIYSGNGRVVSALTSGVSENTVGSLRDENGRAWSNVLYLRTGLAAGAGTGPAPAPAPSVQCCPEAKWHNVAEFLGIASSTPFTAAVLDAAIGKWLEGVPGGRNYGSAQGANYMHAAYGPLAAKGSVPAGSVPFCVKADGNQCPSSASLGDVLAALPGYFASVPGTVAGWAADTAAAPLVGLTQWVADLTGWLPGFFVLAGLVAVGAVLILEGARTMLGEAEGD